VQALAETEGGFEVVPVADGFWQDVDTPAMVREAERRLLRSPIKHTDGPVSRHLNRPISLRLTRSWRGSTSRPMRSRPSSSC
jgi:NDP-sugar pyrophosphorylase family protein